MQNRNREGNYYDDTNYMNSDSDGEIETYGGVSNIARLTRGLFAGNDNKGTYNFRIFHPTRS